MFYSTGPSLFPNWWLNLKPSDNFITCIFYLFNFIHFLCPLLMSLWHRWLTAIIWYRLARSDQIYVRLCGQLSTGLFPKDKVSEYLWLFEKVFEAVFFPLILLYAEFSVLLFSEPLCKVPLLLINLLELLSFFLSLFLCLFGQEINWILWQHEVCNLVLSVVTAQRWLALLLLVTHLLMI